MLVRMAKRLLRKRWRTFAVASLLGLAAPSVATAQGNEAPLARFGTLIEIEPGTAESSIRREPPCAEIVERPIDLDAALRLAGIDNPTILLAQERIQEALAGQLAARSLLLPSLNAGGNFRNHTGVFQDDPGFLRDPHLQSVYVGAGTGAIGAGTVAVPGVWLFAHLGDAAYAPIAARRQVIERSSDAQAVHNSTLRDVASAYLRLVEAERRRDILRRAETEIAGIARVTAEFAAAGQGARADANRSAANLELVRRQLHEADGGVDAAIARLAQLLTLDPSLRLRTPDGTVELIRLVAEDSDLESLTTIAIRSRPELTARAAQVQEAQIHVRQERVRPLLPLVAVGFSSGGFGGGSNQVADDFSPLKTRTDFAVMAVWDLQNLGFGNHARVSEARAIVGQAAAELDLELNRVRREVAEAARRDSACSRNRSRSHDPHSRRPKRGSDSTPNGRDSGKDDRSRRLTASVSFSTLVRRCCERRSRTTSPSSGSGSQSEAARHPELRDPDPCMRRAWLQPCLGCRDFKRLSRHRPATAADGSRTCSARSANRCTARRAAS